MHHTIRLLKTVFLNKIKQRQSSSTVVWRLRSPWQAGRRWPVQESYVSINRYFSVGTYFSCIMQVRHVVGLVLLMAAAVPLQMYLIKYNQDFRDLVSEINKNLPNDLLQLSTGYVTEYVHAVSKCLIPLNNLKPFLKLGMYYCQSAFLFRSVKRKYIMTSTILI